MKGRCEGMREENIKKALDIICSYGSIDGDHHKAWVIDQVSRVLTGCQEVEKQGIDCNGNYYKYTVLGESEEYKRLVSETCDGEDGPDSYDWPVGIAP